MKACFQKQEKKIKPVVSEANNRLFLLSHPLEVRESDQREDEQSSPPNFITLYSDILQFSKVSICINTLDFKNNKFQTYPQDSWIIIKGQLQKQEYLRK